MYVGFPKDIMCQRKFSFAIALMNYILKHITMNKTVIYNCNKMSQYYNFHSISDQINSALVSIRDFFQKHKKCFRPQHFE